LEFKSLIISIVGFLNCFFCLVWALELGAQITDEERSLLLGQKKFRNPTIELISDLNSNCQLYKPRDRTTRPVENVALTTKGLQEKTQLVSGTTVE